MVSAIKFATPGYTKADFIYIITLLEEEFMSHSYLVTGGAGFVGSHVAEKLLGQGEKVVILDNFNSYYDPAFKRANIARLGDAPGLTVIEGDIRDKPLLESLYNEHQITHVAHLAAMAGVRTSVYESPLYVDVNINGTLNLLELSRDYKVEQFVFASTSSVYGRTENLPFVETDSADHPLASYPATKRSAELLAHTYFHLFGLNVICLRFFNVYGPAGRPDMMPMLLMNATIDGRQMKLFNGGDISRDWTYIDDTVLGVVAALDRPMGYEIINLGVGSPISLTSFVEMIEEYSGKEINKISVETPLSEPLITFCNNQKARKLLDFAPSITVEDGLKRTWDWFRDYHNL